MGKYENNIINYILLTLVCMNFLQKGSVVLVVFCLYNFFLVEKYINRLTMVLFLMAVSMLPVIILSGSETFNGLVKTVNYVFPFFVGYNGYNKADNITLYIKRTLFSMFLGYSLQTIFMYIYNLSLGTTGRNLISIWTNEKIAVTLVGLLSAFVVGYSFSIIIFDKFRIHKIIAIVSMVFVVLINMQTATRTPFIMMLLTAGMFLTVLIFEKSSMNKVKYLGIFVFIGFCIVLAIAFNVFGFKDYILSSNVFERFNEEGMETGRIDIMKFYFDNMFKYPWGGSNVENLYGLGAHNIWQQCYDDYGCIAGFLLLCVTVSIISQFIKLIKIPNKKVIDYTLIGVYFCVIVQMGLEPILAGYPIIFWGLLLIHGITVRYYNERIGLENKI